MKIVTNLSKPYLFAKIITASAIGWIAFSPQIAIAEKASPNEATAQGEYQAPISGWRVGVATGHSPACFGSQREFGHYRCGSFSELSLAPPVDNSFFIKYLSHDLKATRAIAENPVTGQKTWAVESLELTTLLLGRTWDFQHMHYGFGAGIFGGEIERFVTSEDEYGGMIPDKHARTTLTAGYAFSLLAGTTLARTAAGDLSMDLHQIWFATTDAGNPRDERRVWASMPTLAFSWSYQFK